MRRSLVVSHILLLLYRRSRLFVFFVIRSGPLNCFVQHSARLPRRLPPTIVGRHSNPYLFFYFTRIRNVGAGEARKRFKTYVNILSTIKNENNEKFLILRKRYFNECPVENGPNDDLDLFGNPEILNSPGSRSGISEHDLGSSGRLFNEFQSPSPSMPAQFVANSSGAGGGPSYAGQFGGRSNSDESADSPKEPPPYKPPPRVMLRAYQNQEKYGECVDEFKSALVQIGRQMRGEPDEPSGAGHLEPNEAAAPRLPPKSKSLKDEANYTKQQLLDATPTKSMAAADKSGASAGQPPVPSHDFGEDKENVSEMAPGTPARTLDKQISVKEATKKFNRIASEEEASKIISPTAKKKPEKVCTVSICVF